MRALISSVLAIAACSSRPDVITARKLPAAIQGDAAAIVAANNQFAVDVLAKQPTGNAIFSPFSLSTALAMLDAGAAGQTDAELRAALHFTLPGDQTNAAYGALLASLDTGRGYGGYTLATADRLFGQQGSSFEPQFLSITKTDYLAELMPVDFASAPETARTTVDDWVASQTEGEIPELFPSGSIGADTRLVLANAIVFDGNWDIPFDPGDTISGSFHVAGAGDVTVPLMHQTRPISVGSMAGGRIGILPFEGNDLAMLVLLPNAPDGLPQLEAQLAGSTIADALANAIAYPEKVLITLPRFTLAESEDLSTLLPSLGITSALSPATADFSGIDGSRDLFVQSGFHDAMITVDEAGAKAAAATGTSGGVTSAPPPFEADHSFLFAIYDNVTGAILFFGRMQDPSQP